MDKRLCFCVFKKVLLLEKTWHPSHSADLTRWIGLDLELVGARHGPSLSPHHSSSPIGHVEVAVPQGWALMPACLLWMDLSYGLNLSWTWAAITKCYRPGGLNNRDLFFTVLEARMSKIKVLVDLALGEGSLPDLQWANFSLYPHGERKEDPLL